MNELTPANFDYSLVSEDEKSALIYCAGQIQKAKESAARTLIEIGEMLATAQEQFANHGDGVFQQWLESECGFSKRTAYRYLAVHREFKDCAKLAQMEDSALYALSEKSTPKKAVREALKLADKGQKITHAAAKKLIKKHKDAPPRGEGEEAGTDSGGQDDQQELPPRPPGNGTEVPGGNSSKDEFKIQRSKTVKTAEALVRAFDDLNAIRKSPLHDSVVKAAQSLILRAKEWK
jgi:hypothetical protein